MADEETIEVNGVRFTAGEVLSVTLERCGRKIHIDESIEVREVGFRGPKSKKE